MINERQEKIMRLISAGKRVKINDLVEKLGVSIATVRKDLEILEKGSMLKRVYGGAVSVAPKGIEAEFLSRELQNREEKIMIAKQIAEMVEDGDTIALDNGTSTQMIAKQLLQKHNLTIITNSIMAAITLINGSNFNVYMVGGQLRGSEMATSGLMSVDIIKQFSVDKAIVGCSGISRNGWITDYNLEESQVKKAMIDIAKITIVAADSSKIGIEAFAKVSSLKNIDTVVSDWKMSEDDVKWLEEYDLHVIRADDEE